ncbi:MAG: hypothetical protein ABFD44_02495 [Anaerolineaceae bacterium]
MKKLTHWVSCIFMISIVASLAVYDPQMTPAHAQAGIMAPPYYAYLPMIFKPCIALTAPHINNLTIPYSTVTGYYVAVWNPVDGAEQYQVGLTKDDLTTEHNTQNTYFPVFESGVYELKVRAGCGSTWGPWSEKTLYFTLAATSPYTSAPPLVFPADQAVIHTAFPVFKWAFTTTEGGLGLDPWSDTFELQVDDNADFSSPLYAENVGKVLQKQYKSTRWIFNNSTEIYDLQLKPNIPYHWRVREISGSLRPGMSDWASAAFTIAEPYDDCRSMPSGDQTFLIQMGGQDPGTPVFNKVRFNPTDPIIGTQQTTTTLEVAIKQPGDQPIQSVTIYTVYDSGLTTSHPAALVSGTTLSGNWEATYTIPESYCYIYVVRAVATNALGTAELNVMNR